MNIYSVSLNVLFNLSVSNSLIYHNFTFLDSP